MNVQKRKLSDERNDIPSSQRKTKRAKTLDTIEKSTRTEDNQNNDSFDSLIFDGSDVDETVTAEVVLPSTSKISIATTKPKTRNKFIWTETEWDSLDAVEEFLDAEGFALFDDKDLAMGQKFYFRCNKIPKDRKRDEWCAPQYIIFLPSDSHKIILQFNGCDHNHNALLSKFSPRPVSNDMKTFIADLFDSGVTKTNVVQNMITKARNTQQLFSDEPNPTPRQIKYLLSKYRNHNSKPVIKMGDLSEWCEKRMTFPNEKDEAFVLGFECSTTENDQHFKFCMSTPHLLDLLSNAKVISIDATYKLNWMEYPLIILGVVDNMKRFHPMVYCCSSHERTEDYTYIFETVKQCIEKNLKKTFAPKIMVSDAADAIRNGFYNVHEDSAEADVMCFSHVLRNVRKRPFTSKVNKALIIDDIRQIQLASNKSTFELMTDLFIKKWEPIEKNFTDYFQKEWLGKYVYTHFHIRIK